MIFLEFLVFFKDCIKIYWIKLIELKSNFIKKILQKF